MIMTMLSHLLPTGEKTQLGVKELFYAVSYFGITLLALSIHEYTEISPFLWLPSGLGIFIVLRYGYRGFAAVVSVFLLTSIISFRSVSSALLLSTSLGVQAVITHQLFRTRKNNRTTQVNFSDATWFILLMVPLTAVVGALISSSSILLPQAQGWPQQASAITIYGLQYYFGTLLFVFPYLLPSSPPSFFKNFETMSLSVAITTAAIWIFTSASAPAFLLFPIVVWSSIRLATFILAPIILIVGLVATLGTLAGLGPFASESSYMQLVLLGKFLATLTATGLILSSDSNIYKEARRLIQSEIELRKSKSFLTQAQRVGQIGSWEWDVRKNQFMWSDELCRLHGWCRPEHIPRTLDAFLATVHPEDQDTIKSELLRVLTQDGEFEFEERVITPSGETRELLARGKSIMNQNKQVTGIIGTCQDISARKQEERRRNELFIREQKARQEAEHANAAKDRFLATLSHELRTPLTTISSWVQLLRLPPSASNTLDRSIKMIEQATESLNRMIEELLEVSRILSGKVTLDLQNVDLCDLIPRSIESLIPEVEKKRLRLYLNFDDCRGSAHVDPTRIRQIIWNLVNNSIRYTPSGGSISIFAKTNQVGSGFVLQLKVTDTGKGIPKEFLPSIFEPFSQQETSGMKTNRGLGLGLAIVKSLTELHGGTIQAESQGIGLGSTFIVQFPLIEVDWQDLNQDQTRLNIDSNQASQSAISLSGIRVFLIEDEAATREAISIAFRMRGADLTQASSASEAIRKLSTTYCDIILSDIGLPDQSGYELIKYIRSRQESYLSRLPAIALTAYVSTDDIEQALRSGFTRHVSKPVDLNLLIELVYQETQKHRAAA